MRVGKQRQVKIIGKDWEGAKNDLKWLRTKPLHNKCWLGYRLIDGGQVTALE